MTELNEWSTESCIRSLYGTIVFRATHPIWRRRSYKRDYMRTACPMTTGYGSSYGKYKIFINGMLRAWSKQWFEGPGTHSFYQTASDAVEAICSQYNQKVHTIKGNYLSSRGYVSKRGFRSIDHRRIPGENLMLPYVYVDNPDTATDSVDRAIDQLKSKKVKRILMEPIHKWQVPSKRFCDAAADLGIKIISDEAITGYGRCGAKWGHELTGLKNVDGIIFGKASRLCGYFSTDPKIVHQDTTEQFIPSALVQAYHVGKEIEKKGLIQRIKEIGERLTDTDIWKGYGLYLNMSCDRRELPMYDITDEEVEILENGNKNNKWYDLELIKIRNKKD